MRLILLHFLTLLTGCFYLDGQNLEKTNIAWDFTYANGTILEHNSDIGGLIKGRTHKAILRYNRVTDGRNEWEQRYNYPDWGFSLSFQDMGNPDLGQNFGLYGHYTFYFFNRSMAMTIGQGISYNTNPYDAQANFRNIAYGSNLLASTYVDIRYKRRITKHIGFSIGFDIYHYSNGNFKAPNTSTNTFSFATGLFYNLYEDIEYKKKESPKYSEPIACNFTFSSGINESDVIDSGQFSFYNFSVFADKRLSYKSTIQLGAEIFFSKFLKEFIRFRSVAFPEDNLTGDEDYKRVGVFAGYELRLGRTAAYANLGYYIYYPFDFENRLYNRLGLKRYFKEKVFASLSVKSHSAKAEAVEISLGIRL